MSRADAFDDGTADWLDFEEARARILAHARPLETATTPLTAAVGRMLAEEVRADFAMPPWDNSAMDGYAVRHQDLAPGSPPLRIVGESRAGSPFPGELAAGEALRIMTGAPLPRGADTVVRFEDTTVEGERLRITKAPPSGRNVRAGAEDFAAGQLLASPGQPITPAALALLVAAGRSEVVIHRRPRVGLLVSGDELLPAGSSAEVARGQGIIDSNTPMLSAAIEACGAEVRSPGTVPDDLDATVQALEDVAAHTDFVITAGGASVGAHDLFRRALERLGYTLDFWRIKLRPGSPVSMGLLPSGGRTVPVLGLPGNPSSAFVTFTLFANPFIRALSGARHTPLRPLRARAEERIPGAPGLTMFARVRLKTDASGTILARPSGRQGSGLLVPLSRATGLAMVPPDPGHVEPGADVEVIPLAPPEAWSDTDFS